MAIFDEQAQAMVVGCNTVPARVSREAFPTLTGRWLASALDGHAHYGEAAATCGSCLMVSHPDRPVSGATFNPRTKCCTYVPRLANFLVGGILTDDTADMEWGRQTVRERLDARIGVGPDGISSSNLYRHLYRLGGTQTFGRAETLLCPHYNAGSCGIWRHRPGVCATWFCTHSRGTVSTRYWKALRDLCGQVELYVSLWCMTQLGATEKALRDAALSGDDVRPLTVIDLDRRVDIGRYRELWGHWYTNEIAFYSECSERAGSLTWEDVRRIGGQPLEAAVVLAREACGNLDAPPAVEDCLRMADVVARPGGAATVRLGGTQHEGFVEVPAWVLGVLHYFDGRPAESAVAAIEQDTGRRIDAGLLGALVDCRVIVPATRVASEATASKEGRCE